MEIDVETIDRYSEGNIRANAANHFLSTLKRLSVIPGYLMSFRISHSDGGFKAVFRVTDGD